MKKVLKSIAETIFTIYIAIAVVVFIPLNNWNFAKENGFVKWIVLGEIVPTIQATVWPYYVYDTFFSKNISDKDKDYFVATMSALQVFSAELSKDKPSYNDAINYIEVAIQQANLLNTSKIEKNISGFTVAFNDLKKCLPDLKKVVLDKDAELFNKISVNLFQWDEFIQKNKDSLNELFFNK
ncbi:MAG: hypothetical protein WC315_06180 [Candidatus Omnitrophota bacterium]|jgi:hypothetical protein